MNPRRVHELMKANFPTVDRAKQTWINLQERDGIIRGNMLVELIDEFITAGDLLVEVNRKLGDFLPRQDIVSYVQSNVGRGDIRIADRAFRGFVLIATNGVATGGRCIQPEPDPAASLQL